MRKIGANEMRCEGKKAGGSSSSSSASPLHAALAETVRERPGGVKASRSVKRSGYHAAHGSCTGLERLPQVEDRSASGDAGGVVSAVLVLGSLSHSESLRVPTDAEDEDEDDEAESAGEGKLLACGQADAKRSSQLALARWSVLSVAGACEGLYACCCSSSESCIVV